jgi:8-oxo-dGTP pyrophosphatase MutT (NUDIX family)
VPSKTLPMPSTALSKSPVAPIPAATLLLLRDAPEGLEVLMTARHDAAKFAGGAMVFPGGKLDEQDRRDADGQREMDKAFRIAAIREAFEECGLLLARPANAGTMLTRAQLAELLAHAPDIAEFAAFVEGAELVLATDLLVPFAHWITPADQPKRFDTQFFLAPAPEDQVPQHDGHEAVEVRWFTPAGAIAAADRSQIKLVMATRLNLLKLGRARSVAEALDAARRARIVTVQPVSVERPEGIAFRIPAEADYGVTEVSMARIPRA